MPEDPKETETKPHWNRLLAEAKDLGLDEGVGYSIIPGKRNIPNAGKLQRAIWDARAERRAAKAEEREIAAVARAKKAESRGTWSLRAAWAGVLLTLATAAATWYMVLFKMP